MASGAAKVARGSALGTAANLDLRTAGFRPRSVRLWNQTQQTSAEWTETMADASALKRAQTGAATFVTSNGITPLSDGFRLGADANLNAANDVIHWEAVE